MVFSPFPSMTRLYSPVYKNECVQAIFLVDFTTKATGTFILNKLLKTACPPRALGNLSGTNDLDPLGPNSSLTEKLLTE